MSEVMVKFTKALGMVERIHKDQTADAGKYQYNFADINSILAMLKQVLDQVGLKVSQPIVAHGDTIEVTTMLLDAETAEFESFGGPIMPLSKDPQAVGSAITYFRRYGLVSLFALEADDDDGGYAHRAETQQGQRTPAEQETRDIMSALPKDAKAAFIEQFKAEFGCGLSALPESKHGDALTFAKQFKYTPPDSGGEGEEVADG